MDIVQVSILPRFSEKRKLLSPVYLDVFRQQMQLWISRAIGICEWSFGSIVPYRQIDI